MECRFAAINFRVSLACLISYKEVLNFHGDLFSRKYLPREYRENKSLAKLNRFTVIWYILFSLWCIYRVRRALCKSIFLSVFVLSAKSHLHEIRNGCWWGRAMVLGSFQSRGVLLLWHMVGQGPAVLAAGAGRTGCLYIFLFHFVYPIFLF